MNSIQLLSLLQLADPTLPIGSFSHSAGLETYVQYGLVNNSKTAEAFIRQQVAQNIFYTDAAFASLAFDAAANGDRAGLAQLDEECHALKLAKEMRLMSQKLGMRLLKLFTPLCKDPFADRYAQEVKAGALNGHYALVFGLYAAAMKIGKREALAAFFYNAAAGMVTNCVKLIPLGQMEGQAILYSLHPLLEELALAALAPEKDLVGRCCTGFETRCMQHEQLYSRLYMS